MASALVARGLRIVARNWRRVGCEIDIAAVRGDGLFVVEVKCRRFPVKHDVMMQALLGPRKMRALRRGAALLRSYLREDVMSIRLDLAVVVPHADGMRLQYFPDVR